MVRNIIDYTAFHSTNLDCSESINVNSRFWSFKVICCWIQFKYCYLVTMSKMFKVLVLSLSLSARESSIVFLNMVSATVKLSSEISYLSVISEIFSKNPQCFRSLQLTRHWFRNDQSLSVVTWMETHQLLSLMGLLLSLSFQIPYMLMIDSTPCFLIRFDLSKIFHIVENSHFCQSWPSILFRNLSFTDFLLSCCQS